MAESDLRADINDTDGALLKIDNDAADAIFDHLAAQETHSTVDSLMKCGIPAILRGMQSHPRIQSVQEAGVQAILAILTNSTSERNSFILSGGISIVLNTMMMFRKQYKLPMIAVLFFMTTVVI